jgi:hypothetical protein
MAKPTIRDCQYLELEGDELRRKSKLTEMERRRLSDICLYLPSLYRSCSGCGSTIEDYHTSDEMCSSCVRTQYRTWHLEDQAKEDYVYLLEKCSSSSSEEDVRKLHRLAIKHHFGLPVMCNGKCGLVLKNGKTGWCQNCHQDGTRTKDLRERRRERQRARRKRKSQQAKTS